VTAPRTPATKTELRKSLRTARRELADRPQRSRLIVAALDALTVVRSAHRVMAFTTIPGEPEMAGFIAGCVERGQLVLVPEDEPDPAWPGVVIVPGLGFTRIGDRLGQGGGWYDRFLTATGEGCTSIGVAFQTQLLADLPVEPHDVSVDAVVTESGVWWST
jgi:5-formyltetrahydrofolate cyclo-ligase